MMSVFDVIYIYHSETTNNNELVVYHVLLSHLFVLLTITMIMAIFVHCFTIY